MANNNIKIMEVGPRDGYQNVKEHIPTEKKLEIIDGLIEAGITDIEITSFVSPKAVPQMADAKEVAAYCLGKHPQANFYALSPNLRGVVDAWEAGLRHISYVISLSQTHNERNIRRTHEESINELIKIRETYPDLDVLVGIATIFGCPFEGIPRTEDAVAFAKRFYDMGIRHFGLADTIGIATPNQVREVIESLRNELPGCEWQVHIHDTRNMGMVNSLAAIECGITNVSTTLGGLGGCPFAPGASGNTATEDLVYMLERMGYNTGVDFQKLLALSKYQKSFINGVYSGHQVNIEVEVPFSSVR